MKITNAGRGINIHFSALLQQEAKLYFYASFTGRFFHNLDPVRMHEWRRVEGQKQRTNVRVGRRERWIEGLVKRHRRKSGGERREKLIGWSKHEVYEERKEENKE